MKSTTNSRQAIAAEVRAGLARKGMTQRDLASVLDMGLPALSRRMNCHQAFDTDELLAISTALGISFAMFFEGDAA